MFNICDACGAHRPDKVIDAANGQAICPDCGHRHAFIRAPLLLLGGASGSGKSTVARRLVAATRDVTVFDSDILWGPHFDADPEPFCNTWLRVCKNAAQAGKPTLLVGAGTGVPNNIETCVERRYFGPSHYLALTCDDALLGDRLRRRPSWRGSASEDYVAVHAKFNRWFRDDGPKGTPPVEVIDTTRETAEETTARVVEWIRRSLIPWR